MKQLSTNSDIFRNDGPCALFVCLLVMYFTTCALYVSSAQALNPPVLVQDINRNTGALASGGSNEVVNNKFIRMLYFRESGLELSATDSNGTILLKDINPGKADAPIVFLPNNFLNLGSIFFFTVNSSNQSKEIWRTDGSPEGTYKLRTLTFPKDNLGNNLEYTIGYAKFSGSQALIFISTESGSVSEMMLSDGAPSGTFDISLTAPFQLNSPIPAGEGGFFVATTSGGKSLFRLLSNRQIVKIRDFADTPELNGITSLTPIAQGKFLGFADFKSLPDTLIVTDGSTNAIESLNAVSSVMTNPSFFQVLGIDSDRAFFWVKNSTSAGIWETRGDNASTRLLLDLSSGSIPSLRGQIVSVNNGALFHARAPDSGDEFWFSKSPFSSAILPVDISPGSALRATAFPEVLAFSPDKAAFIGQSPEFGLELYTTDGTSSGTNLLLDLIPGKDSGNVNNLRAATSGGFFYFISLINDRITLFKSNGTLSGTLPISNFKVGATDSGSPRYMNSLTSSKHLLSAQTGSLGYNVLVYDDDTGAATPLVTTPRTHTRGVYVGKRGSFILFGFGTQDTGIELWKSDGTTANTEIIKDINSGSASSNPLPFATFTSTVLFWAKDDAHGIELYKTDGTPQGTGLFKEFAPGVADGYITNLVNQTSWEDGAPAFLTVSNANSEYELWVTDGSSDGTKKLSTQPIAPFRSGIGSFVRFGGKVYFPFYSPASGTEIWVSDGTPEGTGVALDLAAGTSSSDPYKLTVLGNKLLFYTRGGSGGLWVSDGTLAGTTRLLTGSPPPTSISYLTVLGDCAVFSWDDSVTGREPWVTDGTISGTFQLKDIEPGAANSFLLHPLAFRDRVYFFASTSALGSELWSTDGTIDGTSLVKDLNPGSESSGAYPIGKTAQSLLVAADDGAHGYELFAVRDQDDLCPGNPDKMMPAVCGCDRADTDTDSDGTPDCLDGCPTNPHKLSAGACGCNSLEFYREGSNVPFCQDVCSGGQCVCSSSAPDANGNGIPDCNLRGEILVRIKKARKGLKMIRFGSVKKKFSPVKLLKQSKNLLTYITSIASQAPSLDKPEMKKLRRSFRASIANSKKSPFTEERRAQALMLLKKLEKRVKKLIAESSVN